MTAGGGGGMEPARSEGGDGAEQVVDISPSGCPLSALDGSEQDTATRELFVYDNLFTVLPHKIGRFQNLKVLKLFSNEVRYLPDLPSLEQLRVQAPATGLSSYWPQGRVGELKTLELHQVPARPSASAIPANVSQLHALERLSICHFSVSFLPPEIGSLQRLKELDFSFNKLKFLPKEIARLGALKILKLSSNKLVELPSDLSNMTSLTVINVAFNKLTSLQSLRLHSMTSLQELDVQFNKLRAVGDIPDWLSCNLEGNDSLDGPEQSQDPLEDEGRDGLANGRGQAPGRLVRRLVIRHRHSALTASRKHKLEEVQFTSEKMVLIGARKVKDDHSADEVSKKEPDLRNEEEVEKSNRVAENNCVAGTEAVDTCTEEKTDMLEEASKVDEDKPEEEDSKELLVRKRYAPGYREDGEHNPKPSKRRKAVKDHSDLSYKFAKDSFCGFGDSLPDGFYDGGRDRPFASLEDLKNEPPNFDSREVILVDRTVDEDLDVIASTARQLLSHAAKVPDHYAGFSTVATLALFVSDCFGGSDKTLNVRNMRRAALGSTSGAPFVCSCCGTGSSDTSSSSSVLPTMQALSEEAIRHAKHRLESNIVPLGSLPYGVCRHRAILFKYLCDRASPVIPCELVRGYLDYSPHAWNIVLALKDGVHGRLLVDACRPLDIRLESDSEYFCRYIPHRRMHMQGPSRVHLGNDALFPVFHEEIGAGSSGAVVRKCSLGVQEAAAKVRHLEMLGTDKKGPEAWLSELRMYCGLGEHPSVVSFYGHQLRYEPLLLEASSKAQEVPQLIIFMEYVKGGTLQSHIKRFKDDGHLHMPARLAFRVAQGVARGLVWLHSRGIMHRDIKSSNILVDSEVEGSEVVKICDFDSAVPMGSSSVHTCYLAHHGVPLTHVCVGTPRWLAPEVLSAIYSGQHYGLEADMWSFGCVLAELLTLEFPYAGVEDSELPSFIEAGQRPSITWTFDKLKATSDDKNLLEMLMHVYELCTELDPTKRPTAAKALSMLSSSEKDS